MSLYYYLTIYNFFLNFITSLTKVDLFIILAIKDFVKFIYIDEMFGNRTLNFEY